MKPSPSSDAGSVTGESEDADGSLRNGNLARLSSADLRYLQELRAEPGSEPALLRKSASGCEGARPAI